MATSATISSPWLTLSNTTLLRFLHQFKPAPGEALSDQLKRRCVQFRTGRRLLYSIIVLDVLRILYLNYHLATGGSLEEQQPYAPLFTVGIKTFNFVTGETLLIVGTAVAVFAITIDYLVCFKADHRILELAHQLVVDNGEQLLALNKRQLGEPVKRFCYRRPHHFFRQNAHLLRSIWSAKNLKFKKRQLEAMPNVSSQLRARLVVYSAALEWICYVLCLLIMLLPLLFLAAFLYMIHGRLPLAIVLFLIFDISFIIYCGISTIRVGFLGVHLGMVFSFVSNHHIEQLNLELRHAFGQLQLAILRYRYLNYFYHEYARLKSFAKHVNAIIVSPLYAVIFFTLIILSIVILSHLLFKSLLPSEKLLLSIAFCIIVCIPLAGCVALVRWSTAFYSSEPVLFQAQYLLAGGGRPQRLYQRAMLTITKVKLLTFYELVCTKDRFRFTLGPFGRISKRSLYEFCFLYSGMVMYVSGMIRDGQTNENASIGEY